MPAKSRRQQKWAFAAKGEAWAKAHHFDTVKASPKKKTVKKKGK